MRNEIYSYITNINKWYQCNAFALVLDVLGSGKNLLDSLAVQGLSLTLCTTKMMQSRGSLSFLGSTVALISFHDIYSLEQLFQRFNALPFEVHLCRTVGILVGRTFIALSSQRSPDHIVTLYVVYHKSYHYLYELLLQPYAHLASYIIIVCYLPTLYVAAAQLTTGLHSLSFAIEK